MAASRKRRYTVSEVHRMMDESVDLDEALSDIDVQVNIATNMGDNWGIYNNYNTAGINPVID